MARGIGEDAVDQARASVRALSMPVVRGKLRASEFQHLIKLSDPKEPLEWKEDMHLSLAANAHYTNTYREMKEGLLGQYNFLEGDVRLRHNGAVMAHNEEDFSMTFSEWLYIANRSKRGVKIDIKEGAAVDVVLKILAKENVSDHKVIMNVIVGSHVKEDNVSYAQIRKVRKSLPNATINISLGDIPYEGEITQKAISAAKASGDKKRTMFPLQAEYITPGAVRTLSKHGMIAAWNIPLLYNVQDISKETARLRKMGVDGMIDLRKEGDGEGLFPYRLPSGFAKMAIRLGRKLEVLRRNRES